MRVLLLEDDPDLADVLALGLRNEHYATDVARTRAEATELLALTEYDLACLDLNLPDGDGLDLCRELATDDGLRRPRRVLLLTARDAVEDRVAGLDAGADDYLVKPFAFEELLARLRALQRREDRPITALTAAGIDLDPATHEVRRFGSEVTLTPREFALLRYFLLNPGAVLSAEHLLEHVWDANADPFTSSVRVILSRLRRKLGEPSPITTIPGAGYRLDVG